MPTILYDTGTSTGKVRYHRPVCDESPWRRNRDSRLQRSGRSATPHYTRNPFIQRGLQKYYKTVRALLISSA